MIWNTVPYRKYSRLAELPQKVYSNGSWEPDNSSNNNNRQHATAKRKQPVQYKKITTFSSDYRWFVILYHVRIYTSRIDGLQHINPPQLRNVFILTLIDTHNNITYRYDTVHNPEDDFNPITALKNVITYCREAFEDSLTATTEEKYQVYLALLKLADKALDKFTCS